MFVIVVVVFITFVCLFYYYYYYCCCYNFCRRSKELEDQRQRLEKDLQTKVEKVITIIIIIIIIIIINLKNNQNKAIKTTTDYINRSITTTKIAKIKTLQQ